MASVEYQILFWVVIDTAASLAMVYGVRRIFLLEKRIASLEQAILKSKRKR